MGFLRKNKASPQEERGIVLFSDTQDALKAEKILKKTGCSIKLVAPPPKIRKGCDLAVEFDLMEQTSIERELFENDVEILDIISLNTESQKPLEVVKVTNFGDTVLVRSANMKITFNRQTGSIVNVSGGGCPDVPYLHLQMIDKKLTEAPKPRDLGYTLCALMLDKAYEESINIYNREQ